MEGLAVVLCSSFRGKAATEDINPFTRDANNKLNSGIKSFCKHVDECIKEGKLGLEFLDKYPDGYKIYYSS